MAAARPGPKPSRPDHQTPSVSGNRQAPSRKLVNPNSQQTFIATTAEKSAAPRSPRRPATRRLSQKVEAARPTRGTVVARRSAAIGRHGGHQRHLHQVAEPVRQRRPADGEHVPERRVRPERLDQNMGVVQVRRAVLRDERRGRPDGDDRGRERRASTIQPRRRDRGVASVPSWVLGSSGDNAASLDRLSGIRHPSGRRPTRPPEARTLGGDGIGCVTTGLTPVGRVSAGVPDRGVRVAAAGARQGPKSRGADRHRAAQGPIWRYEDYNRLPAGLLAKFSD